MALNPSGAISLGGAITGQSVNLELSKAATALISLNDTDLRTLFGVASGQISLSQGYGQSSGASHGYFLGTVTASPTQGGEINRYTFATNAVNQTGLRLSPGAAKGVDAGGVNTPAKAYFARGNSGTPNPAGAVANNQGSQIDGIVFSSQTYFDSAAELVQPRFNINVNVQSETRGYFGGGSISPFPTQYPQVDGIVFATDSAIDVAAGLPEGSNVSRQHVQSTTRGYFAGAISSPSRFQSTGIGKIDFATEGIAFTGANLVQARLSMSGVHSPTRGYFGGGNYPPSAPAQQTQIDGITFATETQYDAAASLTVANSGKISMVQGGYGIVGYALPGGFTSVDKFTFATETNSDIGAAAGAIAYPSGVSNNSGTQNNSI